MVLNKKMLRSKAFNSLTSAAKQILLELFMRLVLECKRYRNYRRQNKTFYAKNNGELKLTYKEIHRMFGYSTATISKAIDRLVAHGFIEIVELGCGVKRMSHKIALITDRKLYFLE